MSGHGRYADAGTDVEARTIGQSDDPGRRKVRVLLRGTCGALVAGEIHPDAIADGKILDLLPHCVDYTSTILVGGDLGERRRRAIARAKARLPVGGVDTGDDNPDPNLARTGFGHVAINEPKNRRVTGAGIHNTLHVGDDPIISRIIPAWHQQVTCSIACTSRLSSLEISRQASSVGTAVRSTSRRRASSRTWGMIGSEP
jgi:hypothetical protein